MNILKIFFYFKFGLLFALKTIHLGFLFPLESVDLFNLTSYNLSGGVVSLALEKIKEEQLLSGYEFQFSTKFDDCISQKVSAMTYELIKKGVDILFGPSCSKAATITNFYTKFYNKVHISWGIQSYSNIDYNKKFPTLINMSPLIQSTYIALFDFLKHFNWTILSVISASNNIGRCSYILQGFVKFIEEHDTDFYLSFTYKTSIPPTINEYKYFINNIKNKSRIVLVCFDSSLWRRQFYLTIFDMKLNMNEYVFVNIENKYVDFNSFYFNENGKRLKFYEDYNIPNDGRDNDAKEIAQYSFFIDLEKIPFFNYTYTKKILKRIEEYPFYCKSCNVDKYDTLANFSPSLYNGIYMWAKILNTTLSLYGEKALNDSLLYKKYCKGKYKTIFNEFSQDENCHNNANLFITGLNDNGTTTKYFQYSFSSLNTFTKSTLISNLEKEMFKKWNSNIPLNVPKCGFDGKRCLKSFIKKNTAWFVVICVICIIIIIVILLLLIYVLYQLQKNNTKNNYVWKINPSNITRSDISKIKNKNLDSFHSMSNSMNSNGSFRRKQETNKYFYGFYEGYSIVGRKHLLKFVREKTIQNETKECFFLEHENVNKFFGMSIEQGQIYSIWKYCKRGSLFDILESGNSILDSFFCNNMIKDLLAGLIYIHTSSIKFHGSLTSKKCLISDHWQLKISDFNTKTVRCKDEVTTLEKLWISPEILRSEEYIGSPEGDIYSLGIVASEIFTKNYPWDFVNRKESLEELIYLIKRGDSNPIRPEINIADGLIFNPSSITLCKELWKEDPKERPVLKNIVILHSQFSATKTKNLMDHVFASLEDYAQKLKNEVSERCNEIQEEQKKSDILLKKMLPPQVSEKLKLGISVPPEDYNNVTIFFSDIVKFTNLSHKCSPFQVVNILNELFSQFDNVIESLDIYKVETTGDGYLCVSGLPNRNENNHVVEIAKLSLAFIEICNNFKISHLPNEKIMLRIGCNTGPCTAGVVGLSMPRYCLFGDTVNTASRMESNGKPGRIHTTESFYRLLSTFGNFIMEHRGEIIIKGKGVMNTYWLNKMIDRVIDDFNDKNNINNN
uniref:Guanylate cyclase n=1 Tax=Strongyloides stercoralis TaxID=6248 RepID=A0A913HG50_STRER